MSARWRPVWIGLVVVVLAAVEIGQAWNHRARVCVLIGNDGDRPMERLAVEFAGTKVGSGTLAPGASTRIWLSGENPGTLAVSFVQPGNPMSGFLVPDFSPGSLRKNSLMLVLRVKPNQVEQFHDDSPATSPAGLLGKQLAQWISSELSLSP